MVLLLASNYDQMDNLCGCPLCDILDRFQFIYTSYLASGTCRECNKLSR